MWKRRAVWLFLWILSLVGISVYGGSVSYVFFAGVTLVPLLSWIYLIVLFLRFKVYQELGSRNIVCGQTTPYYYALKNEDYFAFAGVSVRMFSDFSFVQGMEEDREYQLLPGEEYRHRTGLVCKYRGEYEVGIREIVVTDFFRLFRLRYHLPGEFKALVLPRLVKPMQLRSVGDLNVLIQRQVQGGRQQPDITVREYAAGDAMKQIHWKASARAQKLMVREQTGEEKQGVSILLSTRRFAKEQKDYLPVENKLLELALALGFFFADKQIPVTLYYGQGGLQKGSARSLRDFDALYKKAAGICFDAAEDPLQTAERALGELAQGSIAFFVVHEMEQAYLTLARHLRQGKTTAFFYVVSDTEPQDYLRLEELSGKIFTVGVEADLEEVL